MDPVRARAGIRRAFTTLLNAINAELDNEAPDRDILRVKLTRLQEQRERLKEVDLEVINSLLEAEAEEAAIDQEYAGSGEYEDKFLTASFKLDKLLDPPRSPSPTPSASSFRTATEDSSEKQASFKFPKFELKKFNGDISDWLGWWAQFKNIHESTKLSNSDKFQFLVQGMVQGSRAQEVVSSYPQSEENYEKAVEALRSRFGKEDLIAELYVRDLLKLAYSNMNSREKLPLSKLYDQLESKLQALESLGRTSKNYSEFLYPLVESSLQEETLRTWQRNYIASKKVIVGEEQKDRLELLMEFLKIEVDNEERILIARAGIGSSDRKPKKKSESHDSSVPTASGLVSTSMESKSCVFCNRSHDSKDCFTAQKMTLEQKREKIRTGRCCFICLRKNHPAKICKANIKCPVCQKKHVILMCPELPGNKNASSSPSGSTVEPTPKGFLGSGMVSQSCSTDVLLQTLMVNLIRMDGTKVRARVMKDTGCQRSSILKCTAEKLNYVPVRTETIQHALYGGTKTVVKEHRIYKVIIEGLDGKFRCNFDVVEEEAISVPIPKYPRGPWLKELKSKKIWLTDLGDEAAEIEVLIGSDIFGRLQKKVVQLDNGITAFDTLLGWTVSGKNSTGDAKSSLASLVTSMIATDSSVSDLWNLEVLGITDPAESKSKKELDIETKEHFLKTVSIDSEGRYEVKLPWIVSKDVLPSNRFVAEKRLQSATKKLLEQQQVENYGNIFKDWMEEGIIEEVPSIEIESQAVHYLPHRPVFKPDSATTKVRPVYDASCKVGKNISLNDGLAKGPNLLELIPSILLRFRERRIGVIADIRKAFLMISVSESDRDYLRFLWWEPDLKTYKVYRHKRVVFGVNCSPFLLGAVIEQHLKKVKGEGAEFARILLKSMYVDNCCVSVDTEEEFNLFRRFSTGIMAEAKMELRMWERSLLDGEDEQSMDHHSNVLGLIWDKKEDNLKINIAKIVIPKIITKRVILSVSHQLYDPLGFLSPATLEPKQLLREACAQKIGWDKECPPEMIKTFSAWFSQLHVISEITVPRRISCANRQSGTWSVHTFVDASKDSYATVIYLRSEYSEMVSVQLVQAKSRVAPTQKMTIPRLELMACLIGCRLTKTVVEALELVDVPIYYWSDSSTALFWIKKQENWGVFVNNRVTEIRRDSDPDSWYHVPGVKNPADLPSRGCSPKQLLESRWWEGPDWLKRPRSEWPSEKVQPEESEVNAERKKTVVSSSAVSAQIPWYLTRFSSYIKIVRLVGWIIRWKAVIRPDGLERVAVIAGEEYLNAERRLWKLVQAEKKISAASIPNLKLEMADDGLFVVITKIIRRDDDQAFLRPVFLPGDHHLVAIMVRQVHLDNNHCGVQCLMTILRERVWIHRCRQLARRIVSKCVTCRRFVAKRIETESSALPVDRVRDAAVFEITGVDLGGHLYLKDGSKAWFAVFTCAVYRAVHLEVVTSLSTEAFIQALRRFIARRSRPRVIYSDQGTNFRGAENLLKNLDWQKISLDSGVERIEWRFNPPTAAWWGGFWERIVGLVKALLRRVLGKSVVNLEELITIFCDVEATLNSRPLTYVGEDSSDLVPLSPSLFLHDISEYRVPDLDESEAKMLQKRLRYRQRLRQDLRQRFRKEYLGTLVQRAKERKCGSVKVGEIVLIGSDDRKRMDWPLGRIVEVFPGKDGVIRVVKVKTSSGELTRPVQRIFPLEIESSEEDFGIKIVSPSESGERSIVTRSGRIVKVPNRLAYS